MPPRRDPLPALTAPRFAAAFAVFIAHAWMFLKGADPLTFHVPCDHIAAAVQFFFLLSGFILTYNYLADLSTPTRRGAWNFLVARWSRLYPVHVLTALAALPLTLQALKAGADYNPFAVALVHLLVLQAFVPVTSPAINAFNGAAWTVSVECFFYLALPLLIPALTRGPVWRRGAVVLLALAPWLAAVASVFGLFALPAWIHPYRFPPVRMVDFVVGVVLCLVWLRRRERVPAAARGATLREVAAVAGLVVWAGAWVYFAAGKTWLPVVPWIGIYLPLFAVCVWLFADGRGVVSRVLAAKSMQYLGEIAYGFYMFHIPVIYTLMMYGWKFGFHKWGWPAQWLAAGAATFALTVTCYHLYEIPLRDKLRRKLSMRRPKADAPAAVPFPAPDAPAKAA